MALSILRPITVKAIVTLQLRSRLLMELRQAMDNADRDLQQLEFQGKKMLLDLERHHPERLQSAERQLAAERQKRLDGKRELQQRITTIEALELGQEVVHSTVQGSWTVELGQNWSAVQGAEIVLQDDLVVEIRGL